MKKFAKGIGVIFLAACLVFWGADKGLDWLIDRLGIVVLANGDISLPETTEETTTPEETSQDPILDPAETLPSIEETSPEETLQEETTAGQETSPEETLPSLEETTPEETLPEETTPEETVSIGETEPVIPETTTEAQTVEETTAPVSTDPEDAPEIMDQMTLRYHYQTIPANEQKVYRQIYLALSNLEESAYVDDLDNDTIWDIYNLVRLDCPEFFWITGQSQLWGKDVFTGKRQLDMDSCVETRKIPATRDQIEAVVAQIMSEMPQGSQYEKAKWTYEYLVKNTDYVYGDNDQNIMSTFLERKTVCAGYARGFQLIMQRLGIMCTYVNGMAGERHAWNLLQLDGDYYYVDATWGDPITNGHANYPDGSNINYGFLCVNDDIISVSRTAWDYLVLPNCDSIIYNYYNQMGTYYDNFNKVTIFDKAREIYGNGGNVIEMQFSSSEAYRRACDAFCYNGFDLELAQYYADLKGRQVSYHTQPYDSCNVLKFVVE